MKRMFQYLFPLNHCRKAAQQAQKSSLSLGVNVWLMQHPYVPSFKSLRKIRLMLSTDTLISIVIRFCLCSGFHLTRSQTAWITFSKHTEYRRPSFNLNNVTLFVVSFHRMKDKPTINSKQFQ